MDSASHAPLDSVYELVNEQPRSRTLFFSGVWGKS